MVKTLEARVKKLERMILEQEEMVDVYRIIEDHRDKAVSTEKIATFTPEDLRNSDKMLEFFKDDFKELNDGLLWELAPSITDKMRSDLEESHEEDSDNYHSRELVDDTWYLLTYSFRTKGGEEVISSSMYFVGEGTFEEYYDYPELDEINILPVDDGGIILSDMSPEEDPERYKAFLKVDKAINNGALGKSIKF